LPKTVLPALNGNEVLNALYRAGFIYMTRRSSHVTVRHPVTMRKTTVPVHGSQDLSAGLVRSIIRQAGLTVEEFRGLLK